MKKLFFLFAAVTLLGACGNEKKTNSSDEVADEKKCESISVDSFLVVAADYVGKELTVKGTVDHVCKHGGKRINVFTNDPNVTIHGEASEGVGSFDVELEGSDVCITGTVLETKIDMAYVDEWETKVKEQIAEEGEEGEDADAEYVESVDNHAKLDKIQEYRDKIEASENGYLAFYDLEVTKYHECDVKKNSDSDSEEAEEHDHDDGEHEHDQGDDHE